MRGVGILLAPAMALAAPIQPFFEPTDLEVEKPGKVDLDLQIGATYGAGALGNRWIVTDVEIDVGLFPGVELDVDFGFAEIAASGGRQWYGDPLWISSKLTLFSGRRGDHVLVLGAQLGPRVPTVNSGVGIGYAGIGLLAWSWQRLHFVANAGSFLEPGPTLLHADRPAGALVGLDLAVDLDPKGIVSFLSELGGAALVSGGAGEAHTTFGLALNPNDWLALSAIFLLGKFPNGDRAGVLLGFSPKFRWF